ncbi:DUF6309 family protein [Streptomyces sp. NPDC058955]|uniref:DUF6309 family protein n=1 Tax=unclassified Streptomyces TaxID=2593676 RepID=UPI003651E9F8
MQIIGPTGFDEVATRFRQDHPVTRDHEANTNQDADSALTLADETFGSWSTVRLSRADIRSVLLPWHLSEGGGRELVPPTGLTVGQAADLLRAHETEFAAANPVCTGKLTRFRTAPITSIYLTTRPVPHEHYAGLPQGTGLVHLDGLHRLLAWELAGRLSPREDLLAYLAGDPTGPDPTAADDSAPHPISGGLRP